VSPAQTVIEIGSLRPEEARSVAELHGSFFRGKEHGYSIANLGDHFLEHAFYRLNLDNPHFHCDVARHEGRVVAFSVYTTNRARLFRYTVRRTFVPLIVQLARLTLTQPRAVLSLLSNLRYVRGESVPETDRESGWWLLLGVLPEYRGASFVERTGIAVAADMAQRMEETMRAHGCRTWYAAPHPWNKAINRFLQSLGGQAVGSDTAQGLKVLYYVKHLDPS
jgi:hypothetical protein